MQTIRLWKLVDNSQNKITVQKIGNVQETKTEKQLEDVITNNPELLMNDLRLIGRQTDTLGGPLDLLGVNEDGQLVIFELKKGALTREAVAQVIDYSSYLSSLDSESVSEHISRRSGKLGIEKIDNFATWYQENYGKTLSENKQPKMVLVGLGADEKTKRMVEFLSDRGVDISLITFHAFNDGDQTFFARQVEVEAKFPENQIAATKKNNLEQLKQKVKKFHVDEFYYNMSEFIRKYLPYAYEWPNPGGYSYSLPELTDSGKQSNRIYLALYLQDNRPGSVQLFIHNRALELVTENIQVIKDKYKTMIHNWSDGILIQVSSRKDWDNIKDDLEPLCQDIWNGWQKKRQEESREEFESATISNSEQE